MCVVCRQHQTLRTLQEARIRRAERPAFRRASTNLAHTVYRSSHLPLARPASQIDSVLATP